MLPRCHPAFSSVEVHAPLIGYAEIGYADLSVGRELVLRRCLVTTGFRRLQESKLLALKTKSSWFERVVGDATDEAGDPGQPRIFESNIEDENLSAARVLVVGDNPISELAAGRNPGMVTVQTLRPGVRRWSATHHVESPDEIWPLIGSPRTTIA